MFLGRQNKYLDAICYSDDYRLSHTLIVAEKQADLLQTSPGFDDNEPYANPGWDADVLRDGGDLPQSDLQHVRGTSYRFGSSHVGFFHAVLGDGSVHALDFSIDLDAHQNLCRMNDSNSNDDF